MAIDLKKMSRGKVASAPRVVWYSFDGVGKTTAAAGAPDPFFLDMNRGSLKHDVARVTPESYAEAREWMDAVERGTVKCQSLVIDSLTELESMSYEAFFPGSDVSRWDGGFGHGDTHALVKWNELIAQLERIRLRGIAILMTAHSRVNKFNDPTGPAYERFELSLRSGLAGKIRQWADYVLFAREEVVIAREKQERPKGVTTGIRYQYTRRCPAFDAKARGTSLFPERLLLGWQPLMEAIQADESRSVEMRQEIDDMLADIGDLALTKKCVDWLRENPSNIVETHNRVKELFETKKQDEAPAEPAAAAVAAQ